MEKEQYILEFHLKLDRELQLSLVGQLFGKVLVAKKME